MKNQSKKATLIAMGLALALFTMSFTVYRGGYGYTLHVNDKLTGQYYLTAQHETPIVTVSEQGLNGNLRVYFNECGEMGSNRRLTARDANQKILKEWLFANGANQHDPMEIALRDVAAFQKTKVSIYYSSARVSKPQVLAYVVVPSMSKIAAR